MSQTADRSSTGRDGLTIAGYYGATFFVLGSWLPFGLSWLTGRGLDEGEAALILAAGIWVRTIALPWLAAEADRRGRRRGALILFTWASLVSFAGLAVAPDTTWLVLGSIAFGLAYPPLIPFCDRIAIRTAADRGLDYGRLRLWGSIAFLVASIGTGAWIEADSAAVLPIPVLVGCVASILLVGRLPDPGARVPVDSTRDRPIRALLSNRMFLIVLLVAGLIQGSHAAYYALSIRYWSTAGIGESTGSLLWAEGVVAEVLLFVVAAPFVRKLGVRRLFLIGAAAGVARWSVMAATTDLVVLTSTNWLHALSFGATHLAAVTYLQRHVVDARSATAQSLLSAVTNGGVMAASTALAGWLYARSPASAFGWMGALAVAGGVIALLIREPDQVVEDAA